MVKQNISTNKYKQIKQELKLNQTINATHHEIIKQINEQSSQFDI